MPSEFGKNNSLCFVFQHGWGFDHLCWAEWQELLPVSVETHLLDRGYLGKIGVAPSLISSSTRVLICHSLGLHFAMAAPELIADVELMVIISGFSCFHGASGCDGRFTRKHTKKMKQRLELEPVGLLKDFYRDCSLPAWQFEPDPLDVDRLLHDLDLLDRSRLERATLKGLPEVLMLHGQKDRIVPLERAKELQRLLSPCTLRVHPEAGHGLPFTHPGWCLDNIKSFLT